MLKIGYRLTKLQIPFSTFESKYCLQKKLLIFWLKNACPEKSLSKQKWITLSPKKNTSNRLLQTRVPSVLTRLHSWERGEGKVRTSHLQSEWRERSSRSEENVRVREKRRLLEKENLISRGWGKREGPVDDRAIWWEGG